MIITTHVMVIIVYGIETQAVLASFCFSFAINKE